MKGILLPCGVSVLLLGCAMLVTGFSRGGNLLEKCGISKENDATLHGCLTDYMKRKMEALENLKNSATKRNYTVIRQIFLESLKCFPADKTKQKMCYMGASYKKSRPGMPKRGKDEFSYGAASMYYQSRRSTSVMLDACEIDEKNTPELFSCLRAIDPKAQEIIRTTKTDVRQGFEKMAKLLSTTKECYKTINAKQGECLLEQTKTYQKNLTELMNEHGKQMVEKLQKCGISKDITDTVMGCTRPKADQMIKLAFEIYEQPEKAEQVWKLVEEMKSCVRKYPEIKKCLMRGGYGRSYSKRQPTLSLNPFHFEQVTGIAVRYIQIKSATFLKKCDLDPRQMPDAFMCFKRKHDAEKDIDSKDPKKLFIAMMRLMNTTASCFDDIEDSKKKCLAEGKDEMVKTVNDNAAHIGERMGKILKSCNAPSDIVACVEPKGNTLKLLAKTLLTDPEIAEKVWNTGASLKDCLKNSTAVEKCVLNTSTSSPKKEGRPWPRKDRKYQDDDHVGMMQKHLKEKSMKMLAECKLTPKNSPAVFGCLIKTFKETNNETGTPKQMFLKGMKLIKSSVVCLNNASDDQKKCLAEKKKEMQEMISEKTKVMEEVMDKMLEACGVSESKTPDLVKCYTPKRTEMKKLVPKLLDDLAAAETAWDLMEGAKQCFENKSDVMKCIKEKKSYYWMSKKGYEKKGYPPKKGYAPKMNFMEKIGMLFKKCGVSSSKTPQLDACLKPLTRKLTGLFYRRDLDRAGKMEELKKLVVLGGKCFGDENKDIKECLKKGSTYLKSEFMERFKEKSSAGFDPKTAMASMDAMYSGCGISEKTPALKGCLDERTRMVMQLKPWLPMSKETREKLMEEGKKYWKCFADGTHDSQLKCMRKIIDGFSKKGKKADSKPKDGMLSEKEIQEIFDKTKAEVLACSKNKCFQDKVKDSAVKLQKYFENMRKGGKDSKFRREITKETVSALFCLRNDPDKDKTFSCLKKVTSKTSGMAKNIKKRLEKKMEAKTKSNPRGESRGWGKKKSADKKDDDDKKMGDEAKNSPRGGPRKWGKRSKRAADDEETRLPFFPLPIDESISSNEETSLTMFELIFNDKSMERVNSLVTVMKVFLSTCTGWTPTPEELKSRPNDDATEPPREAIDHGGIRRQIIDHGGLPARPPSDMFDVTDRMPTASASDNCQIMYDEIISFINTGQGSLTGLHLVAKPHKGKKHDSMIIAACTGSVAVGILILLTIIVIFVTRRRCQRGVPCHQTGAPGIAPTAPCAVGACPPVYTTKGMAESQPPPSYTEALDTEKYEPSPIALSQILTPSTSDEGTEKSC